MKRTATLTLLIGSGLLAACSSNAPLEKKLDYKSEAPKQSVNLEVPPDLTAPELRPRYAIPNGGSASQLALQQQNESTRPQASPADGVAIKATDSMRIERAGTQRWLLVGKQSPQELWPVLKAFWQDNGFTVKTEEPELGIMETEWAENRAKLPNEGLRKLMETVGLGSVYSTPERDKFRARLEKTEAGTEVYFSHKGLYEIYTNEARSETKWQPRAADPELEAEFLARFMLRLGASNDQAKQALSKQQEAAVVAAQPARAQLKDDSLVLNDQFDRAWRRVGLALDRIGLTVTDRNRSQGVYYVRPAQGEVEREQSGGFWSSLAFWRDDKASALAAGKDELRLQLKPIGDEQTVVTLLGTSGQALHSKEARNALSRLQSELK